MKKKIVHVTEAFGGGVLHCVALLANLQAEAGNEVLILHSTRADTPAPAKLDAILDPRIRRKEVNMKTQIGLRDCLSTFRLLIEFARERPDVIHLHSSKAGGLGRIAARLLGMSSITIYSPHGFAFLRKDVEKKTAKRFIFIEKLLHATGGTLVACSPSEVRYARMLLSRLRTEMVENAIDLTPFKGIVNERKSERLSVCTSARVTYQKAPWKFSWLAQQLKERSSAKFVWLGDGEQRAVECWIDKSVIELSGWMSSGDLRTNLSQCDVFLLASLWEGMPISLIEAQAAGLPAVVSRVVGNRDIVVHGVTGFLANTDLELLSYTDRLLSDDSLRKTMGAAAREHALARFGGARFAQGYGRIYEGLLDKRSLRKRNVTTGFKPSTKEK